jgi:L-amino acid N-acyltransferase YncA
VTPLTAQVAIAALVASDRDDVARIYADGIASGVATFETKVPTWEAWDRDHMGATGCSRATTAGPLAGRRSRR